MVLLKGKFAKQIKCFQNVVSSGIAAAVGQIKSGQNYLKIIIRHKYLYQQIFFLFVVHIIKRESCKLVERQMRRS